MQSRDAKLHACNQCERRVVTVNDIEKMLEKPTKWLEELQREVDGEVSPVGRLPRIVELYFKLTIDFLSGGAMAILGVKNISTLPLELVA